MYYILQISVWNKIPPSMSSQPGQTTVKWSQLTSFPGTTSFLSLIVQKSRREPGILSHVTKNGT